MATLLMEDFFSSDLQRASLQHSQEMIAFAHPPAAIAGYEENNPPHRQQQHQLQQHPQPQQQQQQQAFFPNYRPIMHRELSTYPSSSSSSSSFQHQPQPQQTHPQPPPAPPLSHSYRPSPSPAASQALPQRNNNNSNPYHYHHTPQPPQQSHQQRQPQQHPYDMSQPTHPHPRPSSSPPYYSHYSTHSQSHSTHHHQSQTQQMSHPPPRQQYQQQQQQQQLLPPPRAIQLPPRGRHSSSAYEILPPHAPLPPLPPLPPSSNVPFLLNHHNNTSNEAEVGLQHTDGLIYQVQFKRAFYYFSVDRSSTPALSEDIIVGDHVIVEGDRGEDLGVVIAKHPNHSYGQLLQTTSGQRGNNFAYHPNEIRQIHRLATSEEILAMQEKLMDEEDALEKLRVKVKRRKLPMAVVDAEYQFDRKKLTFYFSSHCRIDFRKLAAELHTVYRTRIWLHQVDDFSEILTREEMLK